MVTVTVPSVNIPVLLGTPASLVHTPNNKLDEIEVGSVGYHILSEYKLTKSPSLVVASEVNP